MATRDDDLEVLEAECVELRQRVAALEGAEQRRVEELARTHLHLYEFAGDHSLQELLIETLDAAEKLTESTISFYHFMNADQRTLSLQAWSTRTTRESCTALGAGTHYDIEQAGVWTDCVRTRGPVIHNDYASLPRKKGLPDGHARVIRELVVPILREGLVVAILGVGNKQTDYTQDDVRTVTDLANAGSSTGTGEEVVYPAARGAVPSARATLSGLIAGLASLALLFFCGFGLGVGTVLYLSLRRTLRSENT